MDSDKWQILKDHFLVIVVHKNPEKDEVEYIKNMIQSLENM